MLEKIKKTVKKITKKKAEPVAKEPAEVKISNVYQQNKDKRP